VTRRVLTTISEQAEVNQIWCNEKAWHGVFPLNEVPSFQQK
jgi:hypothetical protein